MASKIEKCPNCGGDAIDRSEFWEAVPENGGELNRKLHQVKKAIKKYFLALDERKHGGHAMSNAFDEIQSILGMSWQPGEVKQMIERHPQLEKLYK